jgi:flagellar hook-associated protein 1 FlgK
MAHQSAMQVIGNNIANAGNPDFTRQTAKLAAIKGAYLPEGMDSGAGVQLVGVERQIDEAIEARLRQALGEKSYDELGVQIMSRLDSLYNELTDEGISSTLEQFFGGFSELSMQPQDTTKRSIVIENGKTLVNQLQTMRNDVLAIYNDLGKTMEESIKGINDLSSQIAQLNPLIVSASSGGKDAGPLLDQRDSLLKSLSQLADIHTVTADNGAVTVYLNNEPLVQFDDARAIQVTYEASGDLAVPKVTFADNNRQIAIEGGRAGAVEGLINGYIKDNLDQLNTLTAGLIFEVNKLHCSGQGLVGYTEITSQNAVLDTDLPLNSSGAGLAFTPINGTFQISVKDKTTGQYTVSNPIKIDLSGLGTQTTMNNLAAQINGLSNLNVVATVTADGRLNLKTTSANYEMTFSEDSSNVLAALGINGFFTGSDASNIAVNPDLISDPRLLAGARSSNPLPGDGKTASLIAELNQPGKSSALLNGIGITEYYQAMVGQIGTQAAASEQRLEIHASIADTLQTQREAISGVSLDEETINLMSNQSAFQGAARFISVINQLLQEVMQLL